MAIAITHAIFSRFSSSALFWKCRLTLYLPVILAGPLNPKTETDESIIFGNEKTKKKQEQNGVKNNLGVVVLCV